MSFLSRTSKADRHAAAGDRYVASGGSRQAREACDRTAQEIAHAREVAEAARAELRRHG